MTFVGFDGVLSENGTLLWCGELDSVHGVRAKRVVQEYILEAFGFSDVVVVGDVDSERAAVCCKANDVESCEVRSEEIFFLHLTRPWELWDNFLRVDNELLELTRLFLVDNGNPTFIVGTRILRVDVRLNPSHVCLNNWALILHPSALRIFMSGNRSCGIGLNVLLEHNLLSLICHIRKCFFKEPIHLFEVSRKFSKLYCKDLVLVMHDAVSIHIDASNSEQVLVGLLFKSTSVQDIEPLGDCFWRLKEFLGDSKVILIHISREVCSDAALIWEIQLSIGSFVRKNFVLNKMSELTQSYADCRVSLVTLWVRAEDAPE